MRPSLENAVITSTSPLTTAWYMNVDWNSRRARRSSRRNCRAAPATPAARRTRSPRRSRARARARARSLDRCARRARAARSRRIVRHTHSRSRARRATRCHARAASHSRISSIKASRGGLSRAPHHVRPDRAGVVHIRIDVALRRAPRTRSPSRGLALRRRGVAFRSMRSAIICARMYCSEKFFAPIT